MNLSNARRMEYPSESLFEILGLQYGTQFGAIAAFCLRRLLRCGLFWRLCVRSTEGDPFCARQACFEGVTAATILFP